MEFGFDGAESSDFDAELEEFELVKTRKMDRHLKSSGGGGIMAGSVLHEGIIYFASADSYVYAVNAETGKEVFRVMTSKYGNCMQPAVNENMVLQPSRNGVLFAFDKKGRELWRFNLGNLPSSVVIHEDSIFSGSESGTLHALTLGGEEKWRFQTGGKLFGAVVIWKGMIYLPSFDCRLYCLSAEGKEKWRFATSDVNVTKLAPPHDAFELKVKKAIATDDAVAEARYRKKKGGDSISLSDYHVASEYATTSEYKNKSDYDVSFVMFDGALDGEELWISDSGDLMPSLKTSR